MHHEILIAPNRSILAVLDPVMGDQGRLYVNEDVVPVYKSLLRDADLILPNQFEAEQAILSRDLEKI